MAKSLTYVEIDIPVFAQNSPPDSPVVETTLRFAIDTGYLPQDIHAIPSIKEVTIAPQIVSLGQDLGQRSTLTVTFRDHRHIFNGEDWDSGTFWGKFRARYGLKLRGHDVRLVRGLLGETLAQMETRHYLIESTDGPTPDGEFKLIAKDILKLTDGDRAQAPALSNGFLIAAITTTDIYATLSPTGVGAEYADLGYVAIGGKEIISYGKESHTKLLLHAEAADGSTFMLDSSRSFHTVTVIGNAQIDTAQFQAGASSILFDGTGDGLSLDGSTDFVLGTGDCTIRFFMRPSTLGATLRVLFDGRLGGGSQVTPTVYISATGPSIRYLTSGTDQITSTTVLLINTWYHIELSRVSGTTRLFINGTQEGSSYADANNYIIAAGRPTIAISGVDGTSSGFAGWLDEFQVIKGTGLHSANFTAPTSHAETGGVAGTDILTLTSRSQFNTELSAHDDGDRVQQVIVYGGQDPANLIADLLASYAFVPVSYIPLANWLAETAAFNGRLYSAIIPEPTAVNQLVGELIEQAGLAVWPDEVTQQIRLQVLRPISTLADIYDEENTLTGTLEVREQPDKRLSQVWVYFAKINPLVKEDQIDNYRSTSLNIDEDAEEEYGAASIRKIFSRWIPVGGRNTAERVGSILLSRYRDPPRRLNFELMRYAGQDDPLLGSGYQLGGWPFQDVSGAAITLPIQITRLNPEADRWEVEAEEMLFDDDASSDSPDVHTIIIDSNVFSVNLRDIHDALYAAPVSGDTIEVVIQSGVIVGSGLFSNPAFDVGAWPAGVTINIELKGRIQGKGGNGGGQGNSNGQAGGTALKTTEAINLTWTDGEIWGGGGGGGGSATGGGGEVHGGGGGAGTYPGSGGIGAGGGVSGQQGTATTGGAGGFGFGTGSGGAPGVAGGSAFFGGSGGAAGVAIDGVSFITVIGGAGSAQGAQIN